MKNFLTITLTSILLLGCSSKQAEESAAIIHIPPTQADIKRAEDMVPLDANLKEKYDRSCVSCHAFADAGAPLTGHTASWDVLIEAKGYDGLVQSAKAGINAMPAMGYCPDCTDEDMLGLIKFMAGQEGQ